MAKKLGRPGVAAALVIPAVVCAGLPSGCISSRNVDTEGKTPGGLELPLPRGYPQRYVSVLEVVKADSPEPGPVKCRVELTVEQVRAVYRVTDTVREHQAVSPAARPLLVLRRNPGKPSSTYFGKRPYIRDRRT